MLTYRDQERETALRAYRTRLALQGARAAHECAERYAERLAAAQRVTACELCRGLPADVACPGAAAHAAPDVELMPAPTTRRAS